MKMLCSKRIVRALLLLVACGLGRAVARPSYLPPAVETVEYAPAVVGHTVHSLPTAVSHQSQTIVHEKRPYLRPIVKAHAPTYVKTYAATPTIVGAYTPIATTAAAYDWPLAHSATTLSPFGYSGLGLYDYGWSPSLGGVSSVGGISSFGGGIGGIYGGWNGWPLK